MSNNIHLFVELSGAAIPPALRHEQVHTFPSPLLQQQIGTGDASASAAAQPAQPPAAQQAYPGAADQQFGAVNAGGVDRGALLVSLPVQVLDNGKLRVEQVEV